MSANLKPKFLKALPRTGGRGPGVRGAGWRVLAGALVAVMIAGAGVAVAASGQWHALSSAPTGAYGSPTCVGASDCWVRFERSILATSNGGASWHAQTLAPGRFPTSVSCASAQVCFATTASVSNRALSQPIAKSTNAGGSWAGEAVGGAVKDWGAISCASTQFCAALGSAPGFCVNIGPRCVWLSAPAVATTQNGGRSWTLSKNIMFEQGSQIALTVMYAMSCPAAGTCFAAGFHTCLGKCGGPHNDGTVMASTDAGKHWRFQRLPGGIDLFWSITCANARDCWAAGRTAEGPSQHGVLVATTDGGEHWRSQTPPSGSFSMDAISCSDARNCTSFGTLRQGFASVIVSTRDGGAHWVKRAAPAVSGMNSVLCSTASFCLGTASVHGRGLLAAN